MDLLFDPDELDHRFGHKETDEMVRHRCTELERAARQFALVVAASSKSEKHNENALDKIEEALYWAKQGVKTDAKTETG